VDESKAHNCSPNDYIKSASTISQCDRTCNDLCLHVNEESRLEAFRGSFKLEIGFIFSGISYKSDTISTKFEEYKLYF